MNKLEQKNLFNAYADDFKQQATEGIIERFEVSPKEFRKYIWILHGSVLKSEEQATTKIRIVFKCFLKVRSQYSINEATLPHRRIVTVFLFFFYMTEGNKLIYYRHITPFCLCLAPLLSFLFEAYANVFTHQAAENIIELFEVLPPKFGKYIWKYK